MPRIPNPIVLASILTLYFGLGIITMATRAPWQDEAWFGSPAYNLAYHGFLGTTILDPASSTWKGVKLDGIDRHTYWVLPLNLLVNAANFRLFGFGSFQMRATALLFGAVFLLSWWIILRKLGAPDELRILGLLLIVVDYHFQMQAADGRMDAMAVGLGYAAIAAYLVLRERSLRKAVAISHILAAAAVFTHPNGALPAALLVYTTVYLDRWKLRTSLIPAAAAPYLILGVAWAVYIAQSPGDFRAQFLGNASGRGPTITAPLAALKMEIVNRYLANFGMASWTSPSGRLNLIPLLLLLAGTVACYAIAEIRRNQGYRLILIWNAISVAYLTWFEGLKTPLYLIYITPLYSVLCAIAGYWLWKQRPRWRVAIVGVFAILVLLQAGRTLIIARRDPKATAFLPAVRYLEQHFDRNTFVMGNGALMFGLGPGWNLLDDFRMGYNSGKRPSVVVMDDSWTDRISVLKNEHPEIWTHTQRLLGESREVYNQNGYRILLTPRYRAMVSAPGSSGAP